MAIFTVFFSVPRPLLKHQVLTGHPLWRHRHRRAIAVNLGAAGEGSGWIMYVSAPSWTTSVRCAPFQQAGPTSNWQQCCASCAATCSDKDCTGIRFAVPADASDKLVAYAPHVLRFVLESMNCITFLVASAWRAWRSSPITQGPRSSSPTPRDIFAILGHCGTLSQRRDPPRFVCRCAPPGLVLGVSIGARDHHGGSAGFPPRPLARDIDLLAGRYPPSLHRDSR